MDWINDEGGFVPDATDMPESVKTLVTAKGYKGVEDICTAYTNATSKLGVDPNRLVTLPADGSDTDAWSQVYNKLGRPETVDGYKPDMKPHEGQEVSADIIKEFTAVAHEAGLTNAQVSKVMQFQLDLSNKYEQQNAADEAKQAEIDTADAANVQAKAWDAMKIANSVKTDADLETLVKGGKEAAQKVGLYDLIEEAGLSDNPKWVSALIKLNRSLSDQMTTNTDTVIDVRSNDEKIASITSHPAYLDGMHPDHAKLMKEFNSVFGLTG